MKNMSLMLYVLLWLFPHSFAQRWGDQWMSTVEDGLADARSRGRFTGRFFLFRLETEGAV